MKTRLVLYFIICSACAAKSQSYAFDSVIIGKYVVKTEAYKYSDLSLAWTCYGDTLLINEQPYESYPGYLNAVKHDACTDHLSSELVKYYADTSFVRLPLNSCDCFNGKYYGFNDSLKVQISPMPLNSSNYYYVFYGRKYWSPVTGYVGIKNHSKQEITFEVYPNPVSSSANIVFANGYLPEQLTGMILDMAGNEVMDFSLSENTASTVINTSNLKAGVYTIKINDYDKVYTKRMVIIRQED